ncbi:hypothetical protein JQX13_38875 [Archangium violaceum]|uniref:hypothetical protein n=1 Tax=Archangium violaceum TaxID=83451 RepID=UPI00193B1DFD|nr:hypothetical protein [Archangium violaceum]QRK06047.1 hypothetical protein JQX13_38875 [Archangium violaceum]
MSNYVITHKVPIHITAEPDEVLADANKLEAGSSFSITDATEFEELKHLNSDGYTENVPVWSNITGTIAGTRKSGSATQAVMETARKAKESFFIHVVENPTAVAGSKGQRYEVFIESDEKNFEAGTTLKFNYPLKFKGGPVAF